VITWVVEIGAANANAVRYSTEAAEISAADRTRIACHR
jgi:hypothetical protein